MTRKNTNGGIMTSRNSQKITVGNINRSKVTLKQTQSVHEEYYDFEKATQFFDSLLDRVERKKMRDDDKSDLKDDIGNLKDEVLNGSEADESKLKRLLRNIRRMAPDIFDVIIQTAINPISGLGLVLQKTVRKMMQETNQNI
jgi:hypothetical protein